MLVRSCAKLHRDGPAVRDIDDRAAEQLPELRTHVLLSGEVQNTEEATGAQSDDRPLVPCPSKGGSRERPLTAVRSAYHRAPNAAMALHAAAP